MEKSQVWEIFRNQYPTVSIVLPTTGALVSVTSEEKQENEPYRGEFKYQRQVTKGCIFLNVPVSFCIVGTELEFGKS